MQADVSIINKLGLHARAAAKFVSLSSGFESEIHLSKGSRKVDGKSIMGVMMLAAAKGSNVTLYAEGTDASQALSALSELIADRFGEAE